MNVASTGSAVELASENGVAAGEVKFARPGIKYAAPEPARKPGDPSKIWVNRAVVILPTAATEEPSRAPAPAPENFTNGTVVVVPKGTAPVILPGVPVAERP